MHPSPPRCVATSEGAPCGEADPAWRRRARAFAFQAAAAITNAIDVCQPLLNSAAGAAATILTKV
jgi:hypothetical protein